MKQYNLLLSLQVRVVPEIGDATLGGWVGSMTKDSGVPIDHTTGTFYKAIAGVKYIDHHG